MAKTKDNSALINYDLEAMCRVNGFVAGIDEAGRGPLCGPVVVASCIMPFDETFPQINDSKTLSEKVREALYETIIERALAYSVAVIDNTEIDRINILNATKKGMLQCMESLEVQPKLFIVDAVPLNTQFPTLSIIKGDATSYSVAAASIIAKVTRDRIMRDYAQQYPMYNWLSNKGYGTAQHVAALKEYGACPLHRQTFIKNFFKAE